MVKKSQNIDAGPSLLTLLNEFGWIFNEQVSHYCWQNLVANLNDEVSATVDWSVAVFVKEMIRKEP